MPGRLSSRNIRNVKRIISSVIWLGLWLSGTSFTWGQVDLNESSIIQMLDSFELQHDDFNFRAKASERLDLLMDQQPNVNYDEIFPELIAISNKHFGESHRITAFLYLRYGIVTLLDREKSNERALELLEKALHIREPILPKEHPQLLHNWFVVGVTNLRLERYEESMVAFKKCVELAKVANNCEMVTNCLQRIGQIYFDLEDQELAEAYHELAILEAKTCFDLDDPDLANYYFRAADVNAVTHPKEAEGYYENSLQVLERGQNQETAAYQNASINLAGLLIDQKQYQDALKILLPILPKAQQSEDEETLEIIYENLGAVYRRLKNYPQSLSYYQKSLAIRQDYYEEQSEEMNYIYHNLGEVHQESGNLSEAAAYYQLALRSADTVFASSDFIDNPAVERAYLTTNYADLIKDLDFKGTLFLEWYRRDQDLQQLRIALTTFDRAIDFMYAKRDELISQGSKLVWQDQLFPVIEHFLDALYTAKEIPSFPKIEEKIFQLMERSKALVLMESLLKQEFEVGFPERDSLESIIAEKQNLFTNRQRAVLENEGDRDLTIAMLQAKIDWLEAQSELKKHLPERAKGVVEWNLPSYTDLSTSILAPAQGLLHYFVGEEHVFVLLATKGGSFFHTFPSNDLALRVNRLRLLLNQPDSDLSEFVGISHGLYQLLLAPVLDKVEGIKELIIIPDGSLAALPFEVLLTAKDETKGNFGDLSYLIQRFQVSYAFSVSTLREQRKQSASRSSVAFMGFAPTFGSSAGLTESRTCERNTLASLVENLNEVEALQKIWGGSVVEGDKATRSYFLAEAGKTRILHLATHACVDDSDPARSRIFFSDDYLYVHELYHLPLQADMVVLSACETGVGSFQRGEGVQSLARGFASSGAPSLTLSYWSVSDQSTSELMTDYYSFLRESLPKHAALQAAKQAYLTNQEDVRYLHPYYWAAFVHFGDYSVLEQKNGIPNFRWSILLLVLLPVLLVGFFRFRKKNRKNNH